MLGWHHKQEQTRTKRHRQNVNIQSQNLVVNTIYNIHCRHKTRQANTNTTQKTQAEWGKHGKQYTHCCRNNLQYPYAAIYM